MRVGIDIRKYYDFGIGTYIQNILAEFQKQNKHEFIYFASDEQKKILRQWLNSAFVSENSPKYSLKELFSLSWEANAQHLDLFHAPHYTLPVNLKMPSVVTIHDIIHLRLKEYFSLMKRTYAYVMIKHACSGSSAIIVDSEFGKKELLEIFTIEEKKIHVIPLGVNQLYFAKVKDEEKQKFRQKYAITKPYILYTGSLKPHKNVPLLLKAFKKVFSSHDVQLVFTGESLNDHPHLISYLEQNQMTNSVSNLGKIDQRELIVAYQSASVVVLPSWYEGFGFSMLEAMASGVPAIGARATSIPEIVGDAGLLFDPKDEKQLAQQLNEVLSNSTLRSELIAKGYERAKQFSWKQCAEKTLQVYNEVVK